MINDVQESIAFRLHVVFTCSAVNNFVLGSLGNDIGADKFIRIFVVFKALCKVEQAVFVFFLPDPRTDN